MRNLSSFILLSAVVLLSACSKNNNSAPTTASVMFVNGCVSVTAEAVSAGGVNVSNAQDIAFANNTGYESVTAGSAINLELSLSSSGVVSPLLSKTVSFTAGANYSVFFGGIIDTPQFLATADDLTSPTSGYAKVRFVNLSPNSLNESCYIGTKIDSNVTSGSVTPFFQVLAVTSANVIMQDPNNVPLLAELTGQSFASGRIYTVILTGTSAAATGSPSVLKLTVINNN